MEKMTPEELYRKKRTPLTNEQKEMIRSDAINLTQSELDRSGDVESKQFIPKGIKEKNEEIILDDHSLYKTETNKSKLSFK